MDGKEKVNEMKKNCRIPCFPSRVLVPSVAVLAVAGCTILPSVGPDYREPEFEIPESAFPDAGLPTTNRTEIGEWKPAEGADDVRVPLATNEICNWWCRFNDDVLTNLVASSVSNNLSFLMARRRLEASRWTLLGSYAAFLPHVSGVASATRMQSGPNTGTMWGTGGTMHRDLFAGGFDATWEIDVFGGSRRANEAAWAEAEAAGWSVADAWVSLTAEVGRQYIQLRTTQQRVAVARTNLVLQTETYDILKSRLDSGIGDELAVNQSRYIVDQTHATIPPLLAQEEQLLNALAVLTGDMPGARHAELKDCPDRDWLLEPTKVAGAPLDMIRNRPDVRIAERQLAAQVAKVGVAKAMWYPKLYINGSLGLESVKVQKFLSKDSFYGAIGPSISWPIFQGGNIYASVKAEEARMDEAFLNYDSVLQNAYREVRDNYALYTQEYHRYQALRGAVKAAQDAVAISQDLYKNGLRDFTAVIDAQRSLLSLEEALVVSRGQITIDLISLYKSLGGGLVVE
jgi:NodT family efflux transporter outer membrane factor (OMF) lipoprotein